MSNQRLIEHLAAHSGPLDPLPTGESKSIRKIAGIKAVVFDIYGTLFISGSGDISLADKEDRSPAIVAALETAGFEIIDSGAPWSRCFMETLKHFRNARQAMGTPHPEVHIEEVWKAFIEESGEANWLSGQGDIQLAIVDHECRVNPCWPMPDLDQTLDRLTEKGVSLGIVSNAQFYTPLLFPALLDKPLSAYAFEDKFCVWSWREREGKPSTGLYLKLKDKLGEAGISPEETLYIGNDLRNDIWPAQKLGFQTTLFAGDLRSLRWRADDPECQHVLPDFVITALNQLFEILS